MVRIEVQGRSICRTNLESHSTHAMFLWETSAVDRGAKPRPLESRGCPSSWRTQPRMLTSHALAGRMRSKRHDNAKKESPTFPFYRRSIEPLNSCHRSRNIAESPANTVGECTLQSVMDLRLRTSRISGPARDALFSKPARPPAPLHAFVIWRSACWRQYTTSSPVGQSPTQPHGKWPDSYTANSSKKKVDV